MIVFGDRVRIENTQRLLNDLENQLQQLSDLVDAEQEHDGARALLISSGEITQGLLDDETQKLGVDEWTPIAQHCALMTTAAAKVALNGVLPEAVSTFRAQLECLRAADLPVDIETRTPEGYAFYSLYPELYALASRNLNRGSSEPVTVIGLRSIGMSLAAIVANAIDASCLPYTVRPRGHPFQRELRIGPQLTERLLMYRAGRYAIVDEGPGLSGSSFSAAIDWLISHGIHEDQIELFPSHKGDPGPMVSPSHLDRWKRMSRRVVDFREIQNDLLARVFTGNRVTDSIGDAQDLSAGEWRRHLITSEKRWPPAHIQQERRKYLGSVEGRLTLAKFVGLGRCAHELFNRGSQLSSAGLIPRVQGHRHGFLVTEWCADARPLLEPSSLDFNERELLLNAVANYLQFEAKQLATKNSGASSADLWRMANVNLTEQFGTNGTGFVQPWKNQLDELQLKAKPVATDNKMQPWEWIQRSDGRWLKSDAIEHHTDHQFIGPQDIAWDVAGAICELELDASEAEWLRRRLAPSSAICHSNELFRFYEICYLAFQIGYCAMAFETLHSNESEARRFASRHEYYVKCLTHRQFGTDPNSTFDQLQTDHRCALPS